MPDNAAAHEARGVAPAGPHYWAKRGKAIVGPFPTRSEALAAFYAAHPFNKPLYLAMNKANEVLTGYGTTGPNFDMRWHPARELPA
jgi:hypothetical protein